MTFCRRTWPPVMPWARLSKFLTPNGSFRHWPQQLDEHTLKQNNKKRTGQFAKGQTNAAGVVRVRTIHAPRISKMPTSTFLGCPTQPSTEVIPQRCSGSNSATTFGYQASHTVARSKTAPIILHLATRSAEEVKGHLPLSPSPQGELCRCFPLYWTSYEILRESLNGYCCTLHIKPR